MFFIDLNSGVIIVLVICGIIGGSFVKTMSDAIILIFCPSLSFFLVTLLLFKTMLVLSVISISYSPCLLLLLDGNPLIKSVDLSSFSIISSIVASRINSFSFFLLCYLTISKV